MATKNVDGQLILEQINPSKLGVCKTIVRKHWPDSDFILYGDHGSNKKLEIYISSKTALEIIDFYKTDKFQLAIDNHSGVVYLFPSTDGDQDTRQIYSSGNKAHYALSIGKKKNLLFNALGEFRRMFVIVALSNDHVLIIPDKRNDDNEYA